MYADDSVMYFNAADSQVIADTLTNELVLVNKWLIDNNLFMHEGKTEIYIFNLKWSWSDFARLSLQNTPLGW